MVALRRSKKSKKKVHSRSGAVRERQLMKAYIHQLKAKKEKLKKIKAEVSEKTNRSLKNKIDQLQIAHDQLKENINKRDREMEAFTSQLKDQTAAFYELLSVAESKSKVCKQTKSATK